MEKMSELISELRDNCQKLQSELMVSRTSKPKRDTSNVGIQVGTAPEKARRTSSSSITSESVKKAKSVYGAKQPKPRYHSAGVAHSNSSSVSSLPRDDAKPVPASAPATRSARTVSLSPMKRTTPGSTAKKTPAGPAAGRTHQSLKNGGPKFARPVVKPAPAALASSANSSSISSPSPKPSPSRLPKLSKIPAPNAGSPMRLTKSRIPSAPRYNPPQRAAPAPSPKSPSPPPPPPPTQTSLPMETTSPLGLEVDEDILCVHPDGQVEIRPSSSSRAPSSVSDYFQSPTKLPEPPVYDSPTTTTTTTINLNNANNNNHLGNDENRNLRTAEESSGCSGGENVSSADDEGSRDGDEEDLRRNYARSQQTLTPSPSKDDSSSNDGTLTTPKAKKKPERRVQRTWKHFYQEVSFAIVNCPPVGHLPVKICPSEA